MKYYVRSRFYNTGKVESEIFTESEAVGMDRTMKEFEKFDEYWDEFNTIGAAEVFRDSERLRSY